jgi:hypothetical protein
MEEVSCDAAFRPTPTIQETTTMTVQEIETNLYAALIEITRLTDLSFDFVVILEKSDWTEEQIEPYLKIAVSLYHLRIQIRDLYSAATN